MMEARFFSDDLDAGAVDKRRMEVDQVAVYFPGDGRLGKPGTDRGSDQDVGPSWKGLWNRPATSLHLNPFIEVLRRQPLNKAQRASSHWPPSEPL